MIVMQINYYCYYNSIASL